MLVKEVMKRDVITVSPTASIQDVAYKMKEYNIGSVLVVEDGWKLKGIITDRDIALAATRDFKDPKSVFVSHFMTPDPITINTDADIDSALRIMNKTNIRRLPALENGKLAGMLTLSDLACEMRRQFDQFISLEESYVKQ